LIRGVTFDEENAPHTVWGIAFFDASGVEKGRIEDVFVDRKRAERLVRSCNECELSPIHLFDVVEDALAE
jgi:hypothetical protein